MNSLETIAYFEQLLQVSGNELIEKAVAQGRVPLGYNCYMVPRPLLSAGRAFPVRLSAPGIRNTELADYHLSSVLCSYSRSVTETALSGGYHFLGGLVFANSCQHCTRCGHYFQMKNINRDMDNFFVRIAEAPRKPADNEVEYFISDLKKTAALIADKYGIDMSDGEITKSIRKHNEFNGMLRQISDLRKEDHPGITGSEFHKLMIAAQVAPNDLLADDIKKLQARLSDRDGINEYRARLMVVGPNLDNPLYVGLIEEQGALVVADRFCFGSLPGLEPIPEEGDPYHNMARHYLETCECPRMMNQSQARIDKLLQRVKEYRVDGIVIETIKFCDMWGYEILTMEKGLRAAGIPTVRIEREYALTGDGQFRTRIQAFIESIESKRLAGKLVK